MSESEIDYEDHREIRAATFSIQRSQERGVTMTIQAGALRLRFYIDAQWSDLVHQIRRGEGELGEMVPFEMKPIPVKALKSAGVETSQSKSSSGKGRKNREKATGSANDESGEAADEAPSVISVRTLGAYAIPGISGGDSVFDTPLWRNAFPSLRESSSDSVERPDPDA